MTTTDRIDIAKTSLLARLEAAGLVLDRVNDTLHGVFVHPDGTLTFTIGISIPADLIEATARAVGVDTGPEHAATCPIRATPGADNRTVLTDCTCPAGDL